MYRRAACTFRAPWPVIRQFTELKIPKTTSCKRAKQMWPIERLQRQQFSENGGRQCSRVMHYASSVIIQ